MRPGPASNTKIRTRIAELEKQLAEKLERESGITANWVLQRVAAIAATSLEHFVVIDDKGHPSIDLAKADNVALRGLAGLEIVRCRRPDGRPRSSSSNWPIRSQL
jgi:hypothetical protein